MSPEVPVPILMMESQKYEIGGAGNVARNISNMGAKTTLISLSGIAKGYYNEKDVISLHNYINNMLKSINAHIDEFFISPYHPVNTKDYSNLSHLRKPDTGMLESAATK